MALGFFFDIVLLFESASKLFENFIG